LVSVVCAALLISAILYLTRDGADSRTVVLLGHQAGLRALAYSPDGSLLAGARVDRAIKLWDVATHQEALSLSGHADEVNALAFVPDGEALVSGCEDGTIKKWDLQSGQVALSIDHQKPVYSMAVSPDGQLLISAGDDKQLRIWRMATGASAATRPGYSGWRTDVVFSSDGKFFAYGVDETGVDVHVIEPKDFTVLRKLSGRGSTLGPLALSADDTLLAAGYEDEIDVWEVESGKLISRMEDASSVHSLVFTRDGRLCISGHHGRSIKMWDVASGQLVRTLTGHTNSVYALAVSPDGKQLASGDFNGQIRLWELPPSQTAP